MITLKHSRDLQIAPLLHCQRQSRSSLHPVIPAAAEGQCFQGWDFQVEQLLVVVGAAGSGFCAAAPRPRSSGAGCASGMLLGSRTKISYLCIHVCIQQHVLWLQVPVHHHVPVAVIHCREDLLEKAASLCLLDLREQRREQRWGLVCTQGWQGKEPKSFQSAERKIPACLRPEAANTAGFSPLHFYNVPVFENDER